ncbi:cytochrome P450 [Pelagicoccus albus]|uniref:Cytochrome P450 n=1 Tax=Pelagicoccus albus TaxID=415222 RepID=A0A7X1EBK0_9BACT|nr:cytochrome P450 [Pelagicoccus albus]MBC2607897.1 cytochrome P450 [Pelagicoccus albus]
MPNPAPAKFLMQNGMCFAQMASVSLPLSEIPQFSADDEDVLPELLEDPIGLYLRIYRRHGALCRIRLGGTDALFMGGLEVNHKIWRTSHMWDYARSNIAFKEQIADDHLDSLAGPAHQKKRKILQPMFSMEMVMRFLPALNQYFLATMEEWSRRESVDFMRCWLNHLCRFRFRSFVQEPVSNEQIDRAAEWQFQFIHGIALGEARHQYYARPEYVAIHDEAMELFKGIGKARLEATDAPADCLTAVIENRRGLDSEIDLEALKDDVYMLTVAGIDNIANFIITLLSDIIHQPGLLEKVRAEIDEWDGEDLRAFSQLPVMKAIVLESQRVRPQVVATTASFLYPMESFEFEGYEIPADTPVFHPMILGQFLEEHYADPFKFDETRFWEEEGGLKKFVARTHGFFGGGAHLCIGKNLGLLQGPLLVAQLLKRYDLEGLPKPLDRPKVGRRDTTYLQKMPVRLVPRTS